MKTKITMLLLSTGLLLVGCTKQNPKGNITFWRGKSKTFNTTTVTINNQTQTISYQFSVIPQCGDFGTANFKLQPGMYSYQATDGVYEWEGDILVNSSSCQSIEL